MKKSTIYYTLIIIIIVVAIIGIELYSGVYPPFSVVESYSMEHSNYWQPGIIDEGSIVFVKKVNSINDIKTYVTGRSSDYRTYGEYGNVILYHDGPRIIIHRAMFYLEWNQEKPVILGYNNQSWIKIYNNDVIVLYNIGYAHRNLMINVSRYIGDSGFITAGDHNVATIPKDSIYYNKTYNAYCATDQTLFNIKPVTLNQIVGVAYGDIPWFGLYKLNILRLEGKWPEIYADHVPRYSYLYLYTTTTIILILIFMPYGKISRSLRKK
ncbi:S26 family signal peptidase [Picrophilus oshimae]|nr:S26 family signal peptidase [Picrophilus oshimae]